MRAILAKWPGSNSQLWRRPNHQQPCNITFITATFMFPLHFYALHECGDPYCNMCSYEALRLACCGVFPYGCFARNFEWQHRKAATLRFGTYDLKRKGKKEKAPWNDVTNLSLWYARGENFVEVLRNSFRFLPPPQKPEHFPLPEIGKTRRKILLWSINWWL